MYTWERWYPDAGAQGLPFCRAKIDHHKIVLVHAAPDVLWVEVRDDDGMVIASADQLRRAGEYVPMTRLRCDGQRIVREDEWPEAADIGRVVLLAGAEAGVLRRWWNAPDGSEWRWAVEFYNSALK